MRHCVAKNGGVSQKRYPVRGSAGRRWGSSRGETNSGIISAYSLIIRSYGGFRVSYLGRRITKCGEVARLFRGARITTYSEK